MLYHRGEVRIHIFSELCRQHRGKARESTGNSIWKANGVSILTHTHNARHSSFQDSVNFVPATHCAYCARRIRWSDLALGKAIMDGLDEDVFFAVMDVIGPPYFDWCRQYSPWCIERPACVDCITRALFYLVLGPGSSPIHE